MISFDDPRLTQSLAHGGRLYVGFSGGLDSLALLHMLAQSLPDSHRSSLTAIHVHHGLSPKADDWLEHCQTVCKSMGVSFLSEYVQVDSSRSVEENARKARYQAFEKHLKRHDILAQGHHANDQAETLLFRLERGAGTRGMQGIPIWRSLGQGKIWRPLLSVSRQALEAYVTAQGLSWIEDESNDDSRYRRNFLRHQVLHPWQSNNPSVAQAIASSARLMQQEMSVYDRLASEALAGLQSSCGGLFLDQLPEGEEGFWLSRFVRQKGHSLTEPQLKSVLAMFFSNQEKQPCFIGEGFQLARFETTLYLLPIIAEPAPQILTAGQWLIREHDELYSDRQVEIRGRPQGVSLCLPNGRHRPLKKWLQDQRIPLWWREQLPYVFEAGVLVAIGTLWQQPDWNGVIEWQRKSSLPWPASP